MTQDTMGMQIAIARRIGAISGCRLSRLDVTTGTHGEMIEFSMEAWSPSLHEISIKGELPTTRTNPESLVPDALEDLLRRQETREATGHAAGTPIPYETGRIGVSPWRHLVMDATNLRFLIAAQGDPGTSIRQSIANTIGPLHRSKTYRGGPLLREADVGVSDRQGPSRIAVRRTIDRRLADGRCCVVFGQNLAIPISIPDSVAAQCAGRRLGELADLGPEMSHRRIMEAVPNGDWLRVTMEPVWASLHEISTMGSKLAARTLDDMTTKID